MNKMIIKKLQFLMTCFLCGTIANAQIKGDVTGDGKVNDADIDEVVNIIMGDSANPNGDVNEDSRVNIGDIGAIVNIMMAPVPISEFLYSDGIKYSISGDHVSVVSGDYEYQGDITIPERVTYNGMTYRVTSIEGFAFSGCSGLTSVTIGSSVESIGLYAFSGCSGLTTIVSEIVNPFAISNIFSDDTYTNAELIVPKGTKTAYQTTEGWNRFTMITEASSTDVEQITLSSDDSYEVNIYTLNGLQVARTNTHDYDTIWQQLPKGVYIVKGKKRIK